MNRCILGDCMEYMATLPDNAFDLAITDPPYGLDITSMNMGSESNTTTFYEDKGWDAAPDSAYFEALFRVSRHQIIWGGNYFDLPPTRSFAIWDKKIGNNGFSMCEFAWSSVPKMSKLFSVCGTHLTQGKRIHPTQKPVALYKWLLKNYAKPGQTIFDSHVGSGSIRIACHDMGYDFTGCEIDPDYHAAQEKRFQTHIAQAQLFEPAELTAQYHQEEL